MGARTRSRNSSSSSWEQTIYGSHSTGTNSPDRRETMQDYTGWPFGENALEYTRHEVSGGVLNGTYSGRSYSNRGTYIRDVYPFGGYGSAPQATKNLSASATAAASRTSPSRPILSLPQIIGEMKDIPRMLRHAGRFLNGTAFKHGNNALSAAKEVASENLAIQFGWAPIVSDLAKLVQYTEAYDRRVKELNKLYSGKGLKRRIRLSDHEFTSSASNNAWSAHGVYFLNVPVRSTVVINNWAVVKWQPEGALERKPMPEDFKRILLGLTPQNAASTAWELLPWSWLIDYFTSAGDFISLTNNAVGAQCTGGTIMTQITRTASWDSRSVWDGAITLSGGHVRITHKRRRAFTAFDFSPIAASFPILSGKQLSILTSLAVTRM